MVSVCPVGGTVRNQGSHVIELAEYRDWLMPALAERLCKEDLLELDRSGWSNPLEALRFSAQSSKEVFTAHWDGRIAAVFGISSYRGSEILGVPWMLGAPVPLRHAREFLSISNTVIKRWRDMYPSLFNMVDADHTRAQRWLMSLGFVPLTVHDVNGYPFIEFALTRTSV